MICYEEMNLAHIPAVAGLERENFSLPWSENVLTSELSNPLSLWLVALDEDKVVGYVGAQIVPDEADMMNVAVHPDYRRRGVARMLVGSLVEALIKRGSHRLTLEVRASNEPAKRLYETLGFSQVGLRRNYYRAPREDALILQLSF